MQRKIKSFIKTKLLNDSEIEVFIYDNIADYIYQKNLEIFFLRGKLRENMQVEIIEILQYQEVIEDKDEQKALQKLKEKYHDQGIILNEENYV